MDARHGRAALLAAVLASCGAGYRTTNFVVEAPTAELAKKIGDAAEQYRHELAVLWLGEPMPRWSRPCPIRAQVAPHLGAGGATSFVFDRGEVFNWDMQIQGSEERLLDSVLPHEVTHTIFASHFRQPLPRWADEGACTTVEHPAEKAKQQHMLISFLRTQRGIPFSKMFAMKEYPRDVLPLYSQGYSLARFLIDHGGRQKFLAYIGDGMKTNNWSYVTQQHYGYRNLAELQDRWLDWVKQGSPSLAGHDGEQLASSRTTGDQAGIIYRGQSEDPPAAATGSHQLAAASASPGDLHRSDSDWSPRRSDPQPGGGEPAMQGAVRESVYSRMQTAEWERRDQDDRRAAPPPRVAATIPVAARDVPAQPTPTTRRKVLEWRLPDAKE